MGHPSVEHGGGINGFNTNLARYPDDDLDIVVLSNTPGAHVGRISETIARWALGLEVVSVLDEQVTPEEIAMYEGVYRLAPGLRSHGVLPGWSALDPGHRTGGRTDPVSG